MAKGRDFEQILRQKMAAWDEFPSQNHEQPVATTYQHTPFRWCAESVYRTDQTPSVPLPNRLRYPQRPALKNTKTTPTVGPKTRVELPWSLEQLSSEEKKAYQEFCSVGANLDSNQFTRQDVKKEYRRLLKQLHPDLNPHAFDLNRFAKLQSSSKLLLRTLTKIPV